MTRNSDSPPQLGNGAFRYKLLRTAQGILAKTGLTWKEQHRTCWCSRSLIYGDYGEAGGGHVDFYHNEQRTNASMRGLQRCGNLHTCPVCSSKVGELRKKQLDAAMQRHIRNGQTPEQIIKKIPGNTFIYLLTLTFPHDADDTLADILEKFNKARAVFQRSRQWKKFRKEKRVIGCVNSLEFTVSIENGWHPHVHMLIFCDSQAFNEGAPAANGDLNSNAIEDLTRIWCNTLFKCGLGDNSKLQDMLQHAFNVRGGEHAAAYIAAYGHDERWGTSAEMAKSHSKMGAAGEQWGTQHFTPFQLLIWAEQGDGWAVHRFREYAEAVEGKRALTWSPDLKGTLGVKDVDEETWAKDDSNQQEPVYVGYLTADQYSVIMARKKLPEFLEYVATCCQTQDDLVAYVESLLEMAAVASGALLLKRRHGREIAYTP